MNKKRIRWDIEKVRKVFEERGYKLLSTEYRKIQAKLEIKCPENHIIQMRLDSFLRGSGCNKCGIKKQAEKIRFTLKKAKKIFREGGCKLLEEKYVNSKTKMKYICECGRTSEITLSCFKQGKRCKKCAIEKKAKKLRHIYEEVKDIFRKGGCVLISKEYKNSKQKLNYRCNCGRKSKISLNSFLRGRRCKECGIEKRSGENFYKYNFNLTDEEREKDRYCYGLGKWKKDVREKDNYTCQICGEKEGKLCAHHIESYTPNKELRIIVSNGVLMCENHHKLFHKIYGNGYNTREQFEEFLKKTAKNINFLTFTLFSVKISQSCKIE